MFAQGRAGGARGRLPRLKGVDRSGGVLTLLEELRRYVGFSAADEQTLRELHPKLAPTFPALADAFYARILEHDDARKALERGERHVGDLKITLVKWLHEVFEGPWDAAYVERRARIGRKHVQISLPQHYMVTAMNVVRVELRDRLQHLIPEGTDAGRQARDAVQRVLDIDLALMLHTYREDLEAKQARAERLATFGQLVGSIGHELRNPLGVIETSLFVLKSRPGDDPRAAKHLDRIGQQVVLANDIITQLLDLIRERPVLYKAVPLGPLVEEAVQAVQRPETLTIDVAGASHGTLVNGDPTQLRQVVVNLVDNAVHAAGPTGRVRVSIEQGERVTLMVDDSGAGIDPAVRSRLFEPLVTTRPKGIGLGLALVRRIVERHGGSIDATRGPLGGARFIVQLPLHVAEGGTT